MSEIKHLNFDDYLIRARQLIRTRRPELPYLQSNLQEKIITANSPYELVPPLPTMGKKRYRFGVLLIHGLLDSPFSLLDLGERLARAGIFCRSVLLPGHGTQPEDLINISFHDWRHIVQYGVNAFKDDVDFLYIAGFSTGAILAVQQALLERKIAGLILLAPAIHLRGPADWTLKLHRLKKWLGLDRNPWLYHVKETDYVKYQSIPLNAVIEVQKLIHFIAELRQTEHLNCPVFLVVSQNDETISSKEAIHFFSDYDHMLSQLILYSPTPYLSSDKRFIVRCSQYPDLGIKNFSHVCIPFAPYNPHYGQNGDFEHATKTKNNTTYGAYHRIERLYDNLMGHLNMVHVQRKTLTYNPDFEFMSDAIIQFIQQFPLSV